MVFPALGISTFTATHHHIAPPPKKIKILTLIYKVLGLLRALVNMVIELSLNCVYCTPSVLNL
jgi:hypothetical protein